MKSTVNKTGGVRVVEVGGQRAQARDQVVDRGRPKFTERLVERNGVTVRRIRERPGIIEYRVVQRAFVVHLIKA